MNLPNKLTVARILLVPVFMAFATLSAARGTGIWYLLAGIVFAAASITDLLDGRIARSRGLVTDFGKFADPLADKILTTTAFIYMLVEGVCHPVVLVLVLFREFAVSGLRMVAAGSKDGRVIAANMWGKVKTAVQMASIVFFYFARGFWPEAGAVVTVAKLLCWLCAALTVISGVKYFADNRHFIAETK